MSSLSRPRAIQRVAHTIDNIGGRDLPHLAVHLEDAQKAKTLSQAKEHITRAQGHVNEAVHQSGMLSGAIKVFPNIVSEAKRLENVRAQSDGLVNTKSPPKKNNIPGLAAYISKKKLGPSRISKTAAAGQKGQ